MNELLTISYWLKFRILIFTLLKSSGGAIFHVAVNSKQNLTLYTGKEKKMNGVLTKENIRLEYFWAWSKYWVGYNKGVVNKLYADFGLKSPVLCKDKNYVLIIDEINRGNISKIFGELITFDRIRQKRRKDKLQFLLSYLILKWISQFLIICILLEQ